MYNAEIDKRIERKINKEIDKYNMAYRIEDKDGNQFIFDKIENDCPLYRSVGGSTHIFSLTGYKVIQKYCSL